MATEAWIESAARTTSRPTGNHFGDHLLAMAAHDHAANQLERQRAARCVRRLAPDDAAGVLEILGLDDVPAPAPAPASDVRKQCPRCGQDRPGREYYRDETRPDGLYPYCKPCKRAMAANAHRRRKEGA
ncbi:hypothetical protein GCM10010182_67320 [Actinomadura cremea]|nr:hypothetical protein GCM10010182_67320 [Actinomadura cremea]